MGSNPISSDDPTNTFSLKGARGDRKKVVSMEYSQEVRRRILVPISKVRILLLQSSLQRLFPYIQG